MISRSVRRRVELGRRLAVAWRPTGRNLTGLLRTIATSFVALGVTLIVLPGRQTSGPAAVLGLVLLVIAIGFVVRPLLAGLAVLLGPIGLLLVGLVAQAVVLELAVTLAPDVAINSYARTWLVSLVAASITAVVNWLLDAGSQDAFLAQVLGRVVRIAHLHRGEPGDGQPGVLIVQLDGVGVGLLRQAIVAGAVPTLARWMRSGSHRGYAWHTGLPATTPAGQAVLLHGDVGAVPSFRWYEKESGRLVVTNHPADARLVEERISTGRGLLADGGVSVSNLFSGDAPTRILTMSDARLPPRSTRGLASFAASLGFLRTLIVFAGTVVLETYQARRQRRRDVHPRVARGRVFAVLRGVTAALLHDLNVAIVAEQLARGAPVVYVDFVDYDEIAHHAGPSRPESVRTLDGLDRVLRFFEDVVDETNRRYEIVVVSDHGQAQGEPFAHLAGRPLEELVASLASEPDGADAVPQAEQRAERFGPANVLLTGAARSGGRTLGGLARRRADRGDAARDELTVTLGHDRPSVSPDAPVVTAAGSLAHVYLPDVPGRATREQVDERHPGMVPGLLAEPGVGVVLVRSDEVGGPVVLGAQGWRSLAATGTAFGGGDDPLEPYGPAAARDLLDLDGRAHVGDLVVLGRYDPDTAEVAAFEELVGSHGGLGGDQTEALLIVPTAWPGVEPAFRPGSGSAAAPVLTGPAVHAALLRRLSELGLRPGDAAAAGPEVRSEDPAVAGTG